MKTADAATKEGRYGKKLYSIRVSSARKFPRNSRLSEGICIKSQVNISKQPYVSCPFDTIPACQEICPQETELGVTYFGLGKLHLRSYKI
jgi:hypothetical protein